MQPIEGEALQPGRRSCGPREGQKEEDNRKEWEWEEEEGGGGDRGIRVGRSKIIQFDFDLKTHCIIEFESKMSYKPLCYLRREGGKGWGV